MASNNHSIAIDNDSQHSSSNDSTAHLPRSPLARTIGRSFKQSVVNANNWSIHKVPRRLRKVNEEAYEPNLISVGPYHYNKEHLRVMEVIKKSCFAEIVQETKLNMEAFIKAMEPLKENARACYQDIVYLYGINFVEMMVYDGCFIVQLIRGIHPKEDYFKQELIQTDIWYDLLLLENQLPFFVLCKFYSMIVPNGGGDHGFARLALSFFKMRGQGPEIWLGSETENCSSSKKDIKHLLDLVHNCCHPSQQHQDFNAKAEQQKSLRLWQFIPSATELEEAGISFSAVRDQGLTSLFDIIFTEDTKELQIPNLIVDENTERILRNFMAYEQVIPSGEPRYVSDYVVFMENLIKTGKDVQLLCYSGIIDNYLGDCEALAQMFNKLGDSISLSEDFYYAKIFDKVNRHCMRKWTMYKAIWNKYKAILKRDYFNTPWAFVSFLAAVVLLLLTLIQTIFSVLSYYKW